MEIFIRLIKAWFKRHSVVGFMGESLIAMLDDAKWMFEYLEEVLHDTKGVEIDIDRFYRTDQRINRTEQDIREKIVNHFILNPGQDVPECLILMSLVKDAERLGDYCKNIFEMVKNPFFPYLQECHEEIINDLDGIRDMILEMFAGTRETFSTQNETKAREVLKIYDRAKKGCDAVIEKTVQGERYGLTPGQAVVCALNARFLRRMASHLENINSSVLVPLHRLDFQPNGGDEETPEDN